MTARCLRSVLLLASCAPPPPPPVVAPPPAVPELVLPGGEVWTVNPGTVLHAEGESVATLPYAFTRLEVLGWDSLGLRVRCGGCLGTTEGYLGPEEVVYQAAPPAVAAWGGLAEFAFAVRSEER